ncbi:MAG: PIN domain-containing protein [Candidatus Dormibacteria bacterium]
MIYLDTSGAMRLVPPEAHSDDLSRWFRERLGIPVLSSVLTEVELMRATWRSAPERTAHAADVLRGIGAVTLAPSVVARAAGYTTQIWGHFRHLDMAVDAMVHGALLGGLRDCRTEFTSRERTQFRRSGMHH